MKSILCTRFGTPDELELSDLPDPEAGPGEVIVRVAAIGLNFFDTLLIAGKYQKKPDFPFSPGGEFAGTIESIGPEAGGFSAGDRVIGYCTYGAARELIAIDARKLIRLDVDLDPNRAAGLTITYGTAWHALVHRGELKPGETLAVLGAAGGVGLAAVELGKLLGARVIACASADEKLELARQHGADELVNYRRDDLRTALKSLGGDHGVDVIFDPVGGDFSEAALRAIAWKGRHLVIGFAAGAIPRLPLNLTLLKGCDIRGVYFGDWTRLEPAQYKTCIGDLARQAAAGRIRCHIDRVYPLAEMPQALKVLTERSAMGKVIVTP